VEVRRQYGLTGRSRNRLVQQKGQRAIYKFSASGCSTQAKKKYRRCAGSIIGTFILLHRNNLLDVAPKIDIKTILTGRFNLFCDAQKSNLF
jgi:hypothetical protein